MLGLQLMNIFTINSSADRFIWRDVWFIKSENVDPKAQSDERTEDDHILSFSLKKWLKIIKSIKTRLIEQLTDLKNKWITESGRYRVSTCFYSRVEDQNESESKSSEVKTKHCTSSNIQKFYLTFRGLKFRLVDFRLLKMLQDVCMYRKFKSLYFYFGIHSLVCRVIIRFILPNSAREVGSSPGRTCPSSAGRCPSTLS